jgi:putative membrane protein
MKIITAALISIAMTRTVFAAEQPVQKIDASMPAGQLDEATFVKMVSSSNKFEIDSSKLAVDKAASAEVQAFAEQMIADHTKAGEEFVATLEKKGQEPPAAELTPKHGEQLKQLEGAGDQDFDATYVSLQEAAHVEAVDLFRTYSEKPDDPALGEFAKKTLPTLEMHLEHVKKLAKAK